MSVHAHKKRQETRKHPVVINRDGSLNVHRVHNPEVFFSDLYHYLLAIPWVKFFAIVVLVFFAGNLLFASIYFYMGPAVLSGVNQTSDTERFIECFFFSVQSLNSPFKPVGIWPNVLVTFESYLGMLTLVIITGLLYARFAKPRARVIFSDFAIIGRYNEKPCFIFRVANERLNQIIEARMTLTFTKNETGKEGETSRRFYDLKLERDYSPLFALSWTLRHYIDEGSPLFGYNTQNLLDDQVVIFASLSGIDETFSQTITARSVYRYDEIVFDKRFKDILAWEQEKVRIDLKGIHEMV